MSVVQYPEDMEELFFNGLKRRVGEFNSGVGGFVLNLGCGEFKLPEHEDNFDLQLPDWEAPALRFEDQTVGVIHAYHFLEHLDSDEFKWMLQECARVMKTGAVMNICVPYAKSDLAFQDIDHKTFFTEESWETFLANPYYVTGGRIPLRVAVNFIAGVVGRNLAVFTQLVKWEE